MSAGRAARIDAALDRAIGEKRIVGAVIAIAENGTPAYRRAAGLLDREAGTPMPEDALFRLASVSKAMVAATALALIERGRLALDTAVAEWLPEFRPKLATGHEAAITVRHLLTHTSGLSYGFTQPPGGPYERAGVSDGLDQPGLSLAENLRRIATVPLAFPPGLGWEYSVGIDVLGGLIAKLCGAPLSEAVAEFVTRPLGLTDTGFTVTDRARLTVPYADGKPAPVRMAAHQLVPREPIGALSFAPARCLDASSFQSGGAGMIGTASDLLVFLEAIRQGGAPILTAGTVAAAAQNQVGDLPRPPEDAGWRFGYLSAVLDDPAAGQTPQSRGTLSWGGAYGHTWFIDGPRGLSAAILTNTAIEGVSGMFPAEIRDAVYGVAGDA